MLVAILLLTLASLGCSVGETLRAGPSRGADPDKDTSPNVHAVAHHCEGLDGSAWRTRGATSGRDGATAKRGRGGRADRSKHGHFQHPKQRHRRSNQHRAICHRNAPSESHVRTGRADTRTDPGLRDQPSDVRGRPSAVADPLCDRQIGDDQRTTGPGATFERIGQAKKGDELMIIGRTPDGAWWQVCCLANQPVWVSADLVEAKGPVDTTPLLTPAPTPVPPPPAAPRPAATLAPTPMPPFDIGAAPSFRFSRRRNDDHVGAGFRRAV